MDNAVNYLTSHIAHFKPLIIVGLAIVLIIIEKYAFKTLCPRLIKRSKIWDESLIAALHHPLIFLICATALALSYQSLVEIYSQYNFVDIALLKKVITLSFLAWFCLSLINQLENKITEKTNNHALESDLTTIIALSQISRFVVISALTLVFLQSIGISVSAILAFGGVGALTVGFAAKDTLANLLGGLMIFIDRPFSVGDAIKSPDDQIEGTVEHIGWRLTRIRDDEMNARYVPNALFSTITIINLTRIKGRRIKTILKLRFQDMAELKSIADEIKQFLQSHSAINQDQIIAVSFEDIGDYSLNLLVLAFTKTTNWLEYLDAKQQILLEILNIAHKHKAEYALPLQLTHTYNAQQAGE